MNEDSKRVTCAREDVVSGRRAKTLSGGTGCKGVTHEAAGLVGPMLGITMNSIPRYDSLRSYSCDT